MEASLHLQIAYGYGLEIVLTCRHRSRAPAVYLCHSVCAPLAWATGLACYTAKAAENLRVQYLDYRCESVFRRDKLSDSAL